MVISKCINCAHESPRSGVFVRLGSSFPLPLLNSTERRTSTYARALKTVFPIPVPVSPGLGPASYSYGEKSADDDQCLPEPGDEETLCCSCATILETLFSQYAQLIAITKELAGAGARTPWTKFFQILKHRSTDLFGYDYDNDTQTHCIKLDLDNANWQLSDDNGDDVEYTAVSSASNVDATFEHEGLTRPCFIRIQRCNELTFKKEKSKPKPCNRRRTSKIKNSETMLENQNGPRVLRPVSYNDVVVEQDPEPSPDSADDPDFIFIDEDEEQDHRLSDLAVVPDDEFSVITVNKGKEQVCYKNYLFRKYRTYKDKDYYRCTEPGCKAKLHIVGQSITWTSPIHNHTEDIHKLAILKYRERVRQRAIEEPSVPIPKIMKDEMQNLSQDYGDEIASQAPTYNSFGTTLYRERNKNKKIKILIVPDSTATAELVIPEKSKSTESDLNVLSTTSLTPIPNNN